MSSVSESIVREYFELHEFLVRQHRKHIGQTRGEPDDDIDFFVLNPHPRAPGAVLPFVITSADLSVVAVSLEKKKNWHSETIRPARRSITQGSDQFAVRAYCPQSSRVLINDVERGTTAL